MLSSVQLLLEAVTDGHLIERLSEPSEEAIGLLLEKRDSHEFDTRWMQSFRTVESRKATVAIDAKSSELTTKLREAAFLKSFERWRSHDLAACVSDDFGLIGDAILTEANDPWIDGLWRSYLSGIVPSESCLK